MIKKFIKVEKMVKIYGGRPIFCTPSYLPLSNLDGHLDEKWVSCRTLNPQRRVVTAKFTLKCTTHIDL